MKRQKKEIRDGHLAKLQTPTFYVFLSLQFLESLPSFFLYLVLVLLLLGDAFCFPGLMPLARLSGPANDHVLAYMINYFFKSLTCFTRIVCYFVKILS